MTADERIPAEWAEEEQDDSADYGRDYTPNGHRWGCECDECIDFSLGALDEEI